jgi:microcystin-dependent protein
MATVTGMTAEKIVEITDGSVISAAVDDVTGVLTLQTRGGQTITAGNVGLATDAVDRAYPVGSIFMSTIATDPATQLGVGTWQAWGTGRVPVAVDPAQPEFDVTEKTGGEKTHLLTAGEMPGHTHAGPNHDHDMSHDHGPATTSSAGDHEHTALGNTTAGQDVGTYARGAISGRADDGGALINAAGAHTHTFDVPYWGGRTGGGGTGNTGSAGGNGAHNNLQPYITCYMWKRTA